MKLFRPTGPEEKQLIEETGWLRFPLRLRHQPIFYPVCNFKYAERIAKEWNVLVSTKGYVMEFDINNDFIAKYDRHIVGDKTHEEYWIPAEDLDEFNDNLVGFIKIIAVFE